MTKKLLLRKERCRSLKIMKMTRKKRNIVVFLTKISRIHKTLKPSKTFLIWKQFTIKE